MEERLGPGGEFDLIRRFLQRNAPPGPAVLVGPGDDCAIIAAPRTAISVDLAMEGVHFRREWLAPEEIGYRSTTASLSDLAAMAATPIGVLASLASPPDETPDYAARVMAGVTEAVERYGGTILGGDLVRSSGPLVLDIIAIGEANHTAGSVGAILRSGARPGDEIWVTGSLGGAAAAVVAWNAGEEPEPDARRAFAQPEPRLREARWLAKRGALHALLDLSDGLAGDARHLAAAGDVGILIDEPALPVHPAANRSGRGLELALTGGEDYEICLAAPPGVIGSLVEEFGATFPVALHRIGRVVAPGDVVSAGDEAPAGVVVSAGDVALRREDGTVELLEAGGYQHFRSASPKGL